jgi:hypothetical protein
MPNVPPHASPQPTESEAIVAAIREPKDPGTPLVAPVPLPVDVAADLPVGKLTPAPPAPKHPFGSRPGQTERRHPTTEPRAPLEERRKDDHVGGED